MKRALASLWLILLGGCPAATEPEHANDVRLRIANESAFTFARVKVRLPGVEEEFGPIPPGTASEYRAVEVAYRYAYIEVHLASDTLVLQPIDYVGESVLPNGQYTYALDVGVDPEGKYLSFSFRQH